MDLLKDVLARMLELLEHPQDGTRTDAEGNLLCYYCGDPIKRRISAQMDHVFSRSQGGPLKLWNIVLSCVTCNQAKRDHHPLDWIAAKDLPDDVAIDYMARLLLGVHFAYRKLPALKPGRHWETYQAKRLNWLHLVEIEFPLTLPAYPLNEDVDAAEPCPYCGTAKLRVELPGSLPILVRCKACGEAAFCYAFPPGQEEEVTGDPDPEGQ
jgi:hypothetical protein